MFTTRLVYITKLI